MNILSLLDWEDIDWQRKAVHVRKTKTRGSKKIEKTKTKSSTREVKLLDPAHRTLIAQKEHTLLTGKEVFQNPRTLERWAEDKPIRQCLWLSAIKEGRCQIQAAISNWAHIREPQAIRRGIPMWVAEQMGRKDGAVIRQVYESLCQKRPPMRGDKAVEIFDEKKLRLSFDFEVRLRHLARIY